MESATVWVLVLVSIWSDAYGGRFHPASNVWGVFLEETDCSDALDWTGVNAPDGVFECQETAIRGGE